MIQTLSETYNEAQELNTPRETNIDQKAAILKEFGSAKKSRKSVLLIIEDFKDNAVLKIEEIKSKACQAGFLEHDEHIDILLGIDPSALETTTKQSLLIGLQNELRQFCSVLSRAEDLWLIIHCLQRNEMGDAELFLHLYPNKYVFDASMGKSGEFLVWNGTHWEIDAEKHRNNDMDAVAERYQWAADQISDINLQDDSSDENLKKELKNRAKSLRSAKRCRSVFEFVAPKAAFRGSWDQCPGFLPCLNGIINLSNGELLPHDPKRYIRTTCPTKYDINASSNILDKFIDDIMLGDEEMKAFLGRCLGAALIGDAKEEKIFYFYGKDGRNGKGTLMQSLEKTLGKLARTFNSEMLLMQRNPPSSSSASPDLAKLEGVRFAIFSEINRKRQIDSSKVKNLSGRDTIPCRRLFSNVDLEINPSHTLFIQTNFKPEAAADDTALWKRNVLVPFNAEFVEDPQHPHQRPLDPRFKERLFEEKEAILALLVRGCLEYQKNGLCIPDLVKEGTEEYRRENDGIGRFLKEMTITDSAFSTPKKKMEEAIREYCEANGCNVPTRNEISSYLKETFQESRNPAGTARIWKGVKIVEEGTSND